jgi:hypothetical protein
VSAWAEHGASNPHSSAAAAAVNGWALAICATLLEVGGILFVNVVGSRQHIWYAAALALVCGMVAWAIGFQTNWRARSREHMQHAAKPGIRWGFLVVWAGGIALLGFSLAVRPILADSTNTLLAFIPFASFAFFTRLQWWAHRQVRQLQRLWAVGLVLSGGLLLVIVYGFDVAARP